MGEVVNFQEVKVKVIVAKKEQQRKILEDILYKLNEADLELEKPIVELLCRLKHASGEWTHRSA